MTPKQLKKARASIGLTQPKFAKALGLSLRQLQAFEIGEAPAGRLYDNAVAGLLQKFGKSLDMSRANFLDVKTKESFFA